ncbi:MAG: leucine-rich repeat protein [Bacteroides sp.]|nr:leucine-rich repeat protein [Bacteroides sp.]
MEYPLISEYREAILSAEDNFNKLASLRPVLDSHGDPVMSSGNFAVVFKMKDENDGKCYAVKCFIKDQQGRDESYRKIAEELEIISSSYILPLRYLENELFVDSSQCDCEEFPVVVMEWVEGETLDTYLKRHLNDMYELEMLSYRFNRMAAWLLAQPFAHGDLKPDNILIRKDGSLVLVDYDGIFVPSMKGEKAREIGSPDYRHPLRTDSDFNEHIDDFSIAVIALSLKAIALNPQLKSQSTSGDTLLLSEKDFRSPSHSPVLKDIQNLTSDSELQMLMGIFYIALSKNSLDSISFRLFITDKPKQPVKLKQQSPNLIEKIDTSCTDKDIAEGIADEFGVIYSKDGKRLLTCKSCSLSKYQIKSGTIVICDAAFSWEESLQSVTIPDSVTSIGNRAFFWCGSLQSVSIPDSVTSIGNYAFECCPSLQSVTIPDSVTSIGVNPFHDCDNVKLHISNNCNFRIINNLLISASGVLISCLNNSKIVTIPDSVTSICNNAFFGCKSLQSVTIPDSVTFISDFAFYGCSSLQSISIPNSVTSIGQDAFPDTCKVIRR